MIMSDDDNGPQPSEPKEPAPPPSEPPTLPPPDPSLMDTLTEGVDPNRPIRIEKRDR